MEGINIHKLLTFYSWNPPERHQLSQQYPAEQEYIIQNHMPHDECCFKHFIWNTFVALIIFKITVVQSFCRICLFLDFWFFGLVWFFIFFFVSLFVCFFLQLDLSYPSLAEIPADLCQKPLICICADITLFSIWCISSDVHIHLLYILGLQFPFKNRFIILHVWVFYLLVCLCTMHLVPLVARRELQIFWNQTQNFWKDQCS